MPNLSKLTIRKMRQVIAAIQAEPEFYDQNQFPRSYDCGNTCCGAGWAVWINKPKEYERLATRYSNSHIWVALAREVLGLPGVGESLFWSTRFWPRPFAGRYKRAKTHKGRAAAMAAYWEHFIAKDGKEE